LSTSRLNRHARDGGPLLEAPGEVAGTAEEALRDAANVYAATKSQRATHESSSCGSFALAREHGSGLRAPSFRMLR
jgi:hypothetical protein